MPKSAGNIWRISFTAQEGSALLLFCQDNPNTIAHVGDKRCSEIFYTRMRGKMLRICSNMSTVHNCFMYKVKISELVNILVPSMTVCAMLLPTCIIRRFKDPHIQASRLKSWMFCNTGHLDLRLLLNFLPYLHYFMTTYAFGYWRHRLTHSTLTPKLQ